MDVESQRAAQARAARGALERERAEARAEFAAGILADLRKAQQQANEQGQDLLKAQDKASQTDLRAPADGVVEQLAAHTPGGVVTPAETLMIVVPENQPLTIEARLSDSDVGFVHAGQSVKVKVETFNFTRYGLIDGRVTDVSRDVVESGERQAGDTPAPAGGSQPRPGQPTYIARIALSRSHMMIDGRSEPLSPGMAITAEIKTGERSIISYLLSPLARRTSGKHARTVAMCASRRPPILVTSTCGSGHQGPLFSISLFADPPSVGKSSRSNLRSLFLVWPTQMSTSLLPVAVDWLLVQTRVSREQEGCDADQPGL